MNDDLDRTLASWEAPAPSEQFAERMEHLFDGREIAPARSTPRRRLVWPAVAFGVGIGALVLVTRASMVPVVDPDTHTPALLQTRVQVRAPSVSLERLPATSGAGAGEVIEYVSLISLEGYVVIDAPRLIVERRSR